uniref:Uncharacterized protein n=1 Tax=Triticum urartu TaxID=4572 RepID=A0A8R7K358_TRIUA
SIQPTVRSDLQRKKRHEPHTRARLLSLAHEVLAAATTHAAASGELRRRAARPRAPHGPRLPPLRPDSPLLASTARSQPTPVARVSGRLRRRVSGGPDADVAPHGSSHPPLVADSGDVMQKKHNSSVMIRVMMFMHLGNHGDFNM